MSFDFHTYVIWFYMTSFCTRFVRPHLEYGIQEWQLYLRKDIELLKGVHRSAIELVSSLKHTNYEERLNNLNLTALET